MATSSLPAAHHAAIEVFNADARRLDQRDWRLWSIAGVFIVMMFSTIATMALEIEHRGIDFMSGVQLDTAVRGLMTMVLLFTLFVTYQQIMLNRMRQLLVQGLRRELSAVMSAKSSDLN